MADVNGKDYAPSYGDQGNISLHPNESPELALQKIRTAGSVSIPPELFEKLYLNPEARVKGELRKTFGNPTPVGLAGFLLSLSPLSCFLMDWRGTVTGFGASDITVYLFFGGVLMILAAVAEWVLGNTYIAVVFSTFGAFWLSYGGVLQPFYGAFQAYSPDPDNPALGLSQPGFVNSFAFFLLFMGLLCLIYLICSIRTNLILFLVLLPLPAAFSCLAASFWYAGQGMADKSSDLTTAGGALLFVTCMFGWYLFFALMLASVDAPFQLPVFDLSTKVRGASDRKKSDEAV
ncbi:Protein alcS [Pseudocercospora fuligena]|uniref:Protein alcS n=1 Tax=Pseudocercospora fuligena TaxID=685502 RepID=A0A8H6RGT0_9PEZI|nr:Protein alcS [Pseudocercospora fuligena]